MQDVKIRRYNNLACSRSAGARCEAYAAVRVLLGVRWLRWWSGALRH